MAEPSDTDSSDRRSSPSDPPPSGSDRQGGDRSAKAEEQGGEDSEEGAKPHKGLLQRPVLLIVLIAILLIAAIGGVLYWLNARNYESTDDAFIDTHIVHLAPQISGEVTQVLVKDNQLVQAGQPMVMIDSADVQTRVAQAQAQKAQAQSQVDNARAQVLINRAAYQQALADAAAAAAPADKAARDLARYNLLQRLNAAAVAQQQLDQAQAQAFQSDAQYDAALKAAKSRAEQIKASQTQIITGQDQVRAADAQLNEAGINLGYSKIVAPIAGHIAQKTVAAGDYVQPGTQLLALVPLQLWVTANFKETQLALMRPGQKATLHIDACGSDKIEGRVDSIQTGAGQAFAILPAENATGNYVKVVQRVPVKILIDNPPTNCVIGPGMSVEPTVRVR